MSTLTSVTEGVNEFFEEELITKINGLGKWVVGAGIAMFMENATKTFNELKQNPLIKSLGIIDEGDNIDVDKLYSHLKEQAQKMGSVTLNLPMIGTMTIRSEDLDHLYTDIKKHS